jgi:hypothetical protein
MWQIKNIFSPETDMMVPGRGVNSLTGNVLGNPFKEVQTINPQASGYNVESNIEFIHSVNELNEFFNFTARAKGKYKINRQETHIALYIRLEKPIQTTKVTLDPTALETLKVDSKRFREQFGDGYVSDQFEGGLLCALISVKTEDENEQNKVAEHVKAALASFAKAQLDIEDIKKKASSKVDISISLKRIGGNQPFFITGNDINAVIAAMKTFEQDVNQHPVPFAYGISDYITLTEFPREVQPVDISENMRALTQYNELKEKYIALINDVNFVLDSPQDFVNPPETSKLRQWRAYFQDRINNVLAEASLCAQMKPYKELQLVTPADFNLPIEIGYVSATESRLLGQKWLEEHEQWKGTWTRKGRTRYFDAIWREGDKKISEGESATLRINIIGNQVYVKRLPNKIRPKQTGNFQGKFFAPSKVEGTYQADWARGNRNWKAEIISDPNLEDGSDSTQARFYSRL